MASPVMCLRALRRGSRDWISGTGGVVWPTSTLGIALLTSLILPGFPAKAQMVLKPASEGEIVNLMPTDAAIFEVGEARKDLPCTVVARKPELGFDLRFHGGYDVTLPLNEVSGDGQLLTVVFRVFPDGAKDRASFFTQHIRVPAVDEDAKGDATLSGGLDLGPGKYHVDWLMRDRMERICASGWDMDAELAAKDKSMTLFIRPHQVAQSSPEPFVNDDSGHPAAANDGLNVKFLVNFAPQKAQSAALQRSDTDALVSILKFIERDPHVHRVSLVAFNISEDAVVYRQDSPRQSISLVSG